MGQQGDKPIQQGGSQRGPAQLDSARQNRGIHQADVTIDSPDDLPQASGGSVGSERRRAQSADESAGAGRRASPENANPPVRSSEQDGNESEDDENEDGLPGGGRGSESERPPHPNSRWGS
jgi:hypothetical protein